MFAPDEAQTQWFRYLLQMPTIFAGEYLFDVCLVPVVEDILSSSISGTYSQMCSKRCWNEREFLDHEFLRMTLTVRLRQRF